MSPLVFFPFAIIIIIIVVVIIISFILIRKSFFLSHIYRNRLFRPLTYKFYKTFIKTVFFTIKNGIYITLTNPRLFI